MKKYRLFCAVAVVLMLAGCSSAGKRTGPYSLQVTCGGRQTYVDYWSGGWDGGPEGKNFTACGDPPTAPEVRDRLECFSAKGGDTLALSYAVAPDSLQVMVTVDVPEQEPFVTLYEGKPSSNQVEITLPGNCGGVYSVYANWDMGKNGGGYSACGFLVLHEET